MWKNIINSAILKLLYFVPSGANLLGRTYRTSVSKSQRLVLPTHMVSFKSLRETTAHRQTDRCKHSDRNRSPEASQSNLSCTFESPKTANWSTFCVHHILVSHSFHSQCITDQLQRLILPIPRWNVMLQTAVVMQQSKPYSTQKRRSIWIIRTNWCSFLLPACN